jgi:hypothetical protein
MSTIGLPIMGNLLALTNDPPSKITEWSKEFGKTITISLGWHKVVVINDFQTAKELLFSENVTGREPDDIRNILLNKRGKGLNAKCLTSSTFLASFQSTHINKIFHASKFHWNFSWLSAISH